MENYEHKAMKSFYGYIGCIVMIIIMLLMGSHANSQNPLQYLYADDSCHIEIPDYTELVEVTDNCCLDTVIQEPEAGLGLSPGENFYVTLTALDCYGNSSEVKFEVFTLDTIPPKFNFDFIPPPDTIPPLGDQVKPRVIILTDPNVDPAKEADDKMSLVRLMVVSDQLDIEGIVATVSHNLNYRYVEPIHDVIDAYEEVKPNLDVHSTTYPDPDDLRAVTALGPELYGTTFALNESPISDGAQIIIDAINKDDPRPIWVQVWGDGACIAQALNYIRATEGVEAGQFAASKLRVLDIAGQDDSGAWLMDSDNFPNMFYNRWVHSAWAMDSVSDHISYYDEFCNDECSKGDTYYTSDPWADNNVRSHGPLGLHYPARRYIKEGDSPSLLYVLNNGLNDPEQPSMGSWGGRFMRQKQAGVRSWRDPLNRADEIPETDADPYYMYAAGQDTWTNHLSNTYTSIYTPIFRWWDQFQNDFAVRMDWSINSNYADANHHPVAKIDDDGFNSIIYMNAHAGENVVLNASQSYDPDGDNLSYEWWHYREAGTYDGTIIIENSETSEATVVLSSTANKEIHVVLSVTDNGNPNLTRYRRIVLTIN